MFVPPTTGNGVTLDRSSTLLGGPSLTDRLAESVLQERVLEQIKERFRETELLEPGPQVEAEVLATIQRVVQAYRHEAAIAGTPAWTNPAGMERRLAERALRPGLSGATAGQRRDRRDPGAGAAGAGLRTRPLALG